MDPKIKKIFDITKFLNGDFFMVKDCTVCFNTNTFLYIFDFLLKECKTAYRILFTNYRMFQVNKYKDIGFDLVSNIRNKDYLAQLRSDLLDKIDRFQDFSNRKISEYIKFDIDLYSLDWFSSVGSTKYVGRKFDYIPRKD